MLMDASFRIASITGSLWLKPTNALFQ
jgi:hypothetical protein